MGRHRYLRPRTSGVGAHGVPYVLRGFATGVVAGVTALVLVASGRGAPVSAAGTAAPPTPSVTAVSAAALPRCAELLPPAVTVRVLGASVTGREASEGDRDVRCRHRTSAGSVTLRVQDLGDEAAARRVAAVRAGPGSAPSAALPGARVVAASGARTLVAARGPVLVTLAVPEEVDAAGLGELAEAVRGRLE